MKVLLVEDDIQLNTTISNFLQSVNYKVVSVLDGEVAIDTIDKEDFNLFIIDINIPAINGLEIVKYVRQKDLSALIVIITASIELNNLKSAFKYGCSEYIKKPFFLEELEIRINNLLSKNDENIVNISLTI
jgi:DNA-binding response OmpR family regulator